MAGRISYFLFGCDVLLNLSVPESPGPVLDCVDFILFLRFNPFLDVSQGGCYVSTIYLKSKKNSSLYFHGKDFTYKDLSESITAQQKSPKKKKTFSKKTWTAKKRCIRICYICSFLSKVTSLHSPTHIPRTISTIVRNQSS